MTDKQELIEQVRDPDYGFVGPYCKCGDHEVEILALLEKHGLVINEDGYAVDAHPVP
jgi:hypothetical protein